MSLMTPLDDCNLSLAIDLAQYSIGVSDPNPRVGCLIGRSDGTIVGRGFTQQVGGAHAEVVALESARQQGLETRGLTAWVTLEPCAHFGRTPPCCDALIGAGISRVVVAGLDPNPLVNGQGLARLKGAGIEVLLAGGPLAERARELNIGFYFRMERGRPFVRLKVACTLDGRTALHDGTSRWITGTQARADGHAWRKRANAILTGIGTVLADDPRLDVREVETTVQPLRVVLDSHARIASTARILQPPGKTVLMMSADHDMMASETPYIEHVAIKSVPSGLDLSAVLKNLADRQINELHVEAGPTVTGSFIDQGLVDEVLAYVAPMLLGPGRPLAQLAARSGLDRAERMTFVEATKVGPDLRLRLRPTARH
jgi:diaminohydroxyphosphoribosylaminopyrimidine deaminase / 5-amino-6-(5-phosphoribosylamino)uracil reductase